MLVEKILTEIRFEPRLHTIIRFGVEQALHSADVVSNGVSLIIFPMSEPVEILNWIKFGSN